MELPVTVVFEPPSRDELRALLRLRGLWLAGCLVVLAIGTATFLNTVVRSDALASGPTVELSVSSHPADARVWLDDHERGVAPLDLAVSPGPHRITLRAPDAQDTHLELQVTEQGAALGTTLLRRQPLVTRIRPTLPGATLADVRLLTDGHAALSVSVHPGELDAWRLDPLSGALEPLQTELPATRLAVAGDGEHVAYLGREIGPPAGSSLSSVPSASLVWILTAPFTSPTGAWRAPPGDTLIDASWSPSAAGLLVATTNPTGDNTVSTRLWWLDAHSGAARELHALPSTIVAGSELWSPDGQNVAFMAHAAQLNALCLLGVDGSLRYLADLEPSSTPPPPYAPLEWAADSRSLLFAAPHQQSAPPAPSGWLQTAPTSAVYLARLTEPTPELVADADLALPGWQADGRVIGLAHMPDNGSLPLQLIASSGHPDKIVDVPLRPSSRRYGAQWNASHTRLIVADPGATGTTDYWVGVLGAEDAP